jgi:hypothetical protein
MMETTATADEHGERRRLVAQVTAARTTVEIIAARCALRRWMRRHPGDRTVGATFCRLAIAELRAT